MEESDYDI